MRKKNKIGASELLAQLRASSEWVARRSSEDVCRKLWAKSINDNANPILEELHLLGISVQSIEQLYPKYHSSDVGGVDCEICSALPVLLKHFQYPYHFGVKQQIANVFYAFKAKEAFDDLFLELNKLKQIKYDELDRAYGITYPFVRECMTGEEVKRIIEANWESYCVRLVGAVVVVGKKEKFALLNQYIDHADSEYSELMFTILNDKNG